MNVDRQMQLITQGAEAILPSGELEKKLRAAQKGERPPLRVKFGMDPTAPDIHIGHAVILRKLRTFQEFGHTVVLIIGGFTGQLGDPSGRSSTRPQLSADQVQENAATYITQARKILQARPLEVVDNSQWLAVLALDQVLRLASRTTVARMLERKDFAERYRSQRPIAVSEFLYPLLQGQDSVEIRCDVELGGTDQIFNMLVGRDLQLAAGQSPQTVMAMPLLEGIDGITKMSKTAGNSVGVTDDPADMFGKIMSIPDTLMPRYFDLASGLAPEEIATIKKQLRSGGLHPASAKRQLARAIMEQYHPIEIVSSAEERFNIQFRDHGIPKDIPELELSSTEGNSEEWFLPSLLVQAGLADSGSDARRLVSAGAIRLNGKVLDDPTATLPAAMIRDCILQRGRRQFVRLR